MIERYDYVDEFKLHVYFLLQCQTSLPSSYNYAHFQEE